MKEIKLTQGKVAIVDDSDFEYLNQWKWFYFNGYAAKSKNILMHRLILNTPKGMETDHRNLNRLDNQRYNLRVVTRNQNQHNQTAYKTNSSGYKGVHWHKLGKRWQAQIKVDGKQKYLGLYQSVIIAALAYNIASIGYHGQYGYRNDLS